MTRFLRLLLSGLLLCASLPAWPLPEDRNQPIHIESDRLEIDENRHQSSYSGHVRMQQGSLSIEADRILFIFDANNDLIRLEIDGQPARFEQTGDQGQPLRGQALRIIYRNREALLELTGQARLENGRDLIESERIHYNMDNNALEAGAPESTENGRVRMVIQPGNTSPPATESGKRP